MANNSVKVNSSAIRELLASHNTSIQALCTASGVAEKTAHRGITNGELIKITTLQKFLKPLDVDAMDYIEGGSDVVGKVKQSVDDLVVDFGGQGVENSRHVLLSKFQHPAANELPTNLLFEFDFPPENSEALMLLDRLGPLLEDAYERNSAGDRSFKAQYNKLTYKASIDPVIQEFRELGINVYVGHWQAWRGTKLKDPVYDNGEGGPKSTLFQRNWWKVNIHGLFFTSQRKFARVLANVDLGLKPPVEREDGFLDYVEGRELTSGKKEPHRAPPRQGGFADFKPAEEKESPEN